MVITQISVIVPRRNTEKAKEQTDCMIQADLFWVCAQRNLSWYATETLFIHIWGRAISQAQASTHKLTMNKQNSEPRAQELPTHTPSQTQHASSDRQFQKDEPRNVSVAA